MTHAGRRWRHEGMRATACLLALLALAACASATSPATTAARPDTTEHATTAPLRAARWPEADALFHQDPRWLGADAAMSIDLGDDRTLWLFGDTFVAPGATASQPADRAHATLVRNSIGVQQARDPAHARIAFHWRSDERGAPTSFFPEADGTWFWPGHGVRIGRTLTLFLHAIERTGAGPFDFHSAGWRAIRIDDADAEPTTWALRVLPTPDTHAHGVVGAAVVVERDHVYAFAVREPGSHAAWLLRWPLDDFVAGKLTDPEYWGGAQHGFGAHAPASVFENGATEFSVSRVPGGQTWVQVQSHGFGNGPIALRFAPALVGPWSAPREVFHPPEAAGSGVFCYAGKAHPELSGADLVVTYACNATDAAALLGDSGLYYPRLVRVWLDSAVR